MTASALLKCISIAAACCLLVVAGCNKGTDEDRIRKVITNVQKSAEKKDVQAIIASLSKTYQDSQGNDQGAIKDLLVVYFYMYQKVHVYIPDSMISVEGAFGKAAFQAVLTSGQTGPAANVLPESLGVYAFEVVLRKEEGEWKVSSARWNRVGE